MERVISQKTKCKNPLHIFLAIILFVFIGQTALGARENTQKVDSNAIERSSQEKQVPDAESSPDSLFYPFATHNWDPYAEIQAMREEMDRIFNNFDNRLQMSPFFQRDRTPFAIVPQTDTEETADHYIVTMNIPGAEDSKVNVALEDNILTVSATTRRIKKEKKDRNFIKMERSSGSIHRALAFPQPVQNKGMTTSYKDGVLTVTIPKKRQSS